MLQRADLPVRRDDAAADDTAARERRATGPPARFVVVSADGEPADARLVSGQAKAPGVEAPPLRDLALREVVVAAPVFVLAASLALVDAAFRLNGSLLAIAWFVLAAGLHVAWAVVVAVSRRAPRNQPQGRAARHRMIGLIVACMASLAVAPWCLPIASAADLAPQMLLLGAVALTGAACAGTLPPAALAAVLMPLVGAPLPLLRDLGEGRVELGLASIASSLLGIAVAAGTYRRWRQSARVHARREESLHRIKTERDAAQRADEEKSRFLAIASHDLRQPVHALGLFAATLEKRLTGSPEEPLARNMIRSIEGLDRSFNAMLDISRLDAGTIAPNVQQFPLRDLFRRLHMHFAGQAELNGLGLRFSPGGKSISSDPQLLERILGNLVQNAIKYTESGGVVVVARSTETHINVEVWDTGPGIRAADLPRIFDEFYQVGRSERARAQGLGIGLAIVKRLAMLLGHELTVASTPGRGTMFRIGIRIGGLHDIQDVTAPADTLPGPLPQSLTVLVIDDEAAIRDGLCLLLEEWGYVAVSAGSILQAQRAVSSLGGPPDLILSDLHLGDGPDGIAAIQAVRDWCGHDVMAVLITGDTSHEEMRRATDSGHPVLFKPVQPRRLYNALRGLVAR